MQGQGVRRLYSFMKGGLISGSPARQDQLFQTQREKLFQARIVHFGWNILTCFSSSLISQEMS